MFNDAINKTAKEALAILSNIKELNSFYLAVGTGLTIQIGHRISYDLDFFSFNTFDLDYTIYSITKAINFTNITTSENTLRGFYNDCEISFFLYKYPLLSKQAEFMNIKVASIKDIALMKLIAIGGRGLKKDFYDIYFIIKGYIPLKEIINCFDDKYRVGRFNKFHYIKSLTYFDLADEDDSNLNLLTDVSWDDVKSYIYTQSLKILE